MVRVSVTFAESAIRDLEEIQAWYENELVPEAGQRLVLEHFERVEALRDSLEIGRVVPEFRQTYLRELIHPPIRIVYKREEEKARVGGAIACSSYLEALMSRVPTGCVLSRPPNRSRKVPFDPPPICFLPQKSAWPQMYLDSSLRPPG